MLVIYDQLNIYLKQIKDICSSQFSFRKGKSKIGAIDKIILEIYSTFESRNFRLPLYDMSKAFD